MFKACLLIVALGTLAGAWRRPAAGLDLEDEGALYVVFAPFTQEAARLNFRLVGVEAMGEGGAAHPLTLDLREIRGPEQTRPRRITFSSLPVGRYRGLAISVTSASIDNGGGASSLAVSPEPVFVPVSFRIEKRHVVVLDLELDFRRSIRQDFRFDPVFNSYPPHRPASGLLALVSNRDADTVTVFDKSTGRIAAVIPTGRGPMGSVLDSRNHRAYVALAGEDAVVALDLLELRVLTSVRLRGGDEPVSLAATPGVETLVALGRGSRSLIFIDPFSMVEIDRLTVGDEPEQVLIDAAGRHAWVLNSGSSSITVVDLATRSVAATITTESGPFRAQFDRSGESLFVVHQSSPFLSVIDTGSLLVSQKVYVGPGATALQVNRQTDLLYLSRRGADGIEVFDRFSLLPIDSIPLAEPVSYLAFDGEQNLLFALLPESEEVVAIEVVGKRTRARVEVGAAPVWMILAGEP